MDLEDGEKGGGSIGYRLVLKSVRLSLYSPRLYKALQLVCLTIACDLDVLRPFPFSSSRRRGLVEKKDVIQRQTV